VGVQENRKKTKKTEKKPKKEQILVFGVATGREH
jgi:hypothetical protein